ncbi:IS91 family transposase [Muricomes intestini]|jgi:hypothetical protein|uniref:IS91 family transposase n=1 Tax=Muricomes intestini TaxID=1796634 RepID=UPI002FDF73D9
MMSEAVSFYHSLSQREESCGSYPIRKIFQQFYSEYLDSHTVTEVQHQTACCIADCKTGALGYNISFCKECGHVSIHACACNNRSCPNCQTPLEKKWVLARNSELIEGIAYYHLIFTVPFELENLIHANQKLLYSLFFQCASNTVLTLCKDPKYMGATPGIVSVLHSWGQQLNQHSHLHLMVSGGGLTSCGQFKETRHKGFIVPVRVMGKMFRGKFMDSLRKMWESGELRFKGGCQDLRNHFYWKDFVNLLEKKQWLPFVKETFNGNGNAIEYLARYAYRTAISNSRIVSVNDKTVSFRYTDYKDQSRKKIKTVAGTEFIRLFLQHVLPKGFNRVRFSGFLTNCQKTKKLKQIHCLKNTVYKGNPVKDLSTAELMMLMYHKDICHCSKCNGEMIRLPRGIPLTIKN